MSGIGRQLLGIALGGACVFGASCATAQIRPDRTLPNNSSVTINGSVFNITGGTQVGRNLFHSFQQFSVPTGGTASFNNATDIQSIFSRVTGGSISNIDGLVRANGTANLFLINPNGIIFGPKAQLNIGGSFVASTASSLKFADGTEFSALTLQTTPLLTISVPIGLQFGANPESIVNQSQATNSSRETVGLQVQPGKTLALVGGDVKLERGRLTAPGSQVELGGLAGPGTVELQDNGSTLSLSFPSGVARADVTITNEGAPKYTSASAGVNVVGSGGGSITINARNIDITGPYSRLNAGINGDLAVPNAKAGDITLNATGMITISQLSFIENNQNGANGSPGNISMQAKGSIFVTDSYIDNILFGGVETGNRILPSGNQENSGNLSIQANGSVSFKNSSILNLIYFGYGNTGNVSLQASDSVSFANSGISTTTFGQGKSGNITLQTDTLRLFEGARLQATTRGEGNGGNITVKVNNLEINGGGQIVTAAFNSGNAGSININAKDSITISGSDPKLLDEINNNFDDYLYTFGIVSPTSGIFANTTRSSSRQDQSSSGQGGNIRISTRQLTLGDGAQVTASSLGSGNAGNIEVTARSIQLNNQASIQAATVSSNGGNILLNVQDLLFFAGNSLISASTGIARADGNGTNNITVNAPNGFISNFSGAAGTGGNGGNININAPSGFIVATPNENNEITAYAFNGRGGSININALAIFGFAGFIFPSLNLFVIPSGIVDDSPKLVSSSCAAFNEAAGSSSFTVTGRSGLPPSPDEPLTSDVVWSDTRLPVTTAQHQHKTHAAKPKPQPIAIIPATGWVFNDKGEVTLISSVSNPTSLNTPTSCQAR